VLLGLTAFVSAVVGGIGDVRGAAVGALLIAAVQQFGAAYLSTQLVSSGPAAELARDDKIRRAYLGVH
jgi:branched-subunit amino acid ABC-type transport system permease component